MTYEEFAASKELENLKLRIEAIHKANEAYNQGLWESLWIWDKWKYLVLKRPSGRSGETK